MPAILAALSPHGDEEAEAGWAAFTEECHRDLAARRLAAMASTSLRQAIGDQLPQGPHSGLLAEATAAHTDHPVYPTSRCRHGLSDDELRAYAPEFVPRFALRWAAVPRATVVGALPDWWPTPAMVGLTDDAGPLLPVHPLTVARLDLPLAPEPYLDVTPTLSMRTVAVLADLTAHLKLPLPTATLGARNRRTIAPGTLADGATVQRLLEEIAAREPRFVGRIRHADESSYGHAGDENLAWLLRRYPSDPADSTVLPIAALTADGPAGPSPRCYRLACSTPISTCSSTGMSRCGNTLARVLRQRPADDPHRITDRRSPATSPPSKPSCTATHAIQPSGRGVRRSRQDRRRDQRRARRRRTPLPRREPARTAPPRRTRKSNRMRG